MLIYTTCADPNCEERLLVPTYVGQETHPTCESTEDERLARRFVAAIQREDMGEAGRLEALLNKPVPASALGPPALWYAKQGWAVFPLAPNGKQPLLPKRHGGNGLHDATTDPDRVRAWWTRYPEANIGLVTGTAGFDVIDIDGPTGARSLADLGDGVLPDVHGKALTPNGMHLYVLSTGDGNRAGVRPGIDYRGVGGYVVAPPSQIDFKRYSWAVKPSPAILRGAA